MPDKTRIRRPWQNWALLAGTVVDLLLLLLPIMNSSGGCFPVELLFGPPALIKGAALVFQWRGRPAGWMFSLFTVPWGVLMLFLSFLPGKAAALALLLFELYCVFCPANMRWTDAIGEVPPFPEPKELTFHQNEEEHHD